MRKIALQAELAFCLLLLQLSFFCLALLPPGHQKGSENKPTSPLSKILEIVCTPKVCHSNPIQPLPDATSAWRHQSLWHCLPARAPPHQPTSRHLPHNPSTATTRTQAMVTTVIARVAIDNSWRTSRACHRAPTRCRPSRLPRACRCRRPTRRLRPRATSQSCLEQDL